MVDFLSLSFFVVCPLLLVFIWSTFPNGQCSEETLLKTSDVDDVDDVGRKMSVITLCTFVDLPVKNC